MMRGLPIAAWLFAWGCAPKARSPEPVGDIAPSVPSREQPSAKQRGGLDAGVYATDGPGFRIPVPVGWTWMEGPPNASLQLRVQDDASGVLVEIWRFSGTDVSLRPREGCPWRFQDVGSYEGPGGLQHRSVATCVPDNAEEPRVFAWTVVGRDAVWQVEGHVPPARLIEGIAAVRWLVGEFELLP